MRTWLRENDVSAPAPTPILVRVALGDKAAVRECLARYGNLVWSLARRHAPSDPEDAVQEIFVDLWQSAVRFDPQQGSEATFVAMVARRRLIDRARRSGRRAALHRAAAAEQLGQVASQEAAAEVSAEVALASRVLGELRPEQRQVLLLSTCSGLSHDEIATHTGMPVGTVKAHVRRGLLRMRAALLGVQDEDPR